MARIHGANANYSFNAVAIEGWLDEIRQRASVPEADITSFADIYQNFLPGKKSLTTDVRGSYDPAAAASDATIFAAIGAGVVTTLFYPTGAGPSAGNPVYTCTASAPAGALVARYRVHLPVGEKAEYEATIQHSGATTRAVA